MRKILIAACIGLLGSASAAQTPLVVMGSNAPFKVVNYGDLNLASQSGQERLFSRIRAAARSICSEDNIEEVKFALMRRDCYDTAVNDGLGQMRIAIAGNINGKALATATLTIRGH